MSRAYRYVLLLVFVSMLFACNLSAPAQAPQATATVGAAETAAPIATAAPTDTPNPTDTLAPSDTPEPPTTSATTSPGGAATATFIVNMTEMVGTEAAQLGPMAHMMGYLVFYSNPIGTPAQNWHDVPIMPQATAGQEFQADIYSYKASATLSQADEFYSAKSTELGWACTVAKGSSGSGNQANHSSTFLCKGLLLTITSFDADPKNVLVVINKTP